MSADSFDRGRSRTRRANSRRTRLRLPRIEVDPVVANMASNTQALRVTPTNMRRNSITSDMEDSGYDMLSDITGTSDDDASTDSLSGSIIEDESERGPSSEFRYDVQDTDSEEEDIYPDVRAGDHANPSITTPIINPRSSLYDTLEDEALSSSLSVLTERPVRTDASVLLESAEQKVSSHSATNLWSKLTNNQSAEDILHAMNSPNGKMLLGALGFVAISMLTSSVLTPFLQPNHNNLHQPIVPQHNNVPVARVEHVNEKTPVVLENSAQAKNWPQFEKLQETLKSLKELTSSHSLQTQLPVAANPVSLARSKSTAAASTNKVSSSARLCKTFGPSPKNQNCTGYKVLDKARYSKETEKFYVFLDDGRVTPFHVGHRIKSKHRFGPFTQLTGRDKRFKAEFDNLQGKIKVAHIGPKGRRGTTRIVVSRNGKVLQRGQVDSANDAVTFEPNLLKREEIYGQVQILFASPTDAVFQVSVMDLKPVPVTSWTNPPTTAKQAATDAMRRITDAINVYVAPIRLSGPQRPSGHVKAKHEQQNEPVSSPVTDVLVRAQNHAVAIANAIRVTAITDFQAIRSVALIDFEAANRCLFRANANVVSTFNKYHGEVIRAARGTPRQTLSKAQDRVKELKKTVEKKFAGFRTVREMEPIQGIKKEEFAKEKARFMAT